MLQMQTNVVSVDIKEVHSARAPLCSYDIILCCLLLAVYSHEYTYVYQYSHEYMYTVYVGT